MFYQMVSLYFLWAYLLGDVKISSLSAMEYKIFAIPDGGIGTSFIRLQMYLSIGTSKGDKTNRYKEVRMSLHWLINGYLVIKHRHFGAYIVAMMLCRRTLLLLRERRVRPCLPSLPLPPPWCWSDVSVSINISGSGSPIMLLAECNTA